ncbi:hypothetical protein SteCoe_13172 [Stentor coeruleus]|uniref:non-specific serine/threonine protein kinase n=1 Tax=Stentor coeruleus TaxID=5963 RepID=A0A1R2C912_9CILI|nr:hypothetical protein SteCoe_13172 [Stentor coeruleus]
MGCVNVKKQAKLRMKVTPSSTFITDNSRISNYDFPPPTPSDYEPLSFLGAGGFAEVTACKHIRTKKIRAQKKIPKSKLKQYHLHTSKRPKEAYILESLNHPNILSFYEYFEDKENYYLITEVCKGNSLYSQLVKSGKFSEKKLKETMFQILKAVEYLHCKKIVHRDIKPENVLLTSSNGLNMKLSDFGSADEIVGNEKLFGGFGSVFYLAPEILVGEYDEKIDIWSCGVMMWVLFTGKQPYIEKDQKAIKERIVMKPLQPCQIELEGLSCDGFDFIKKMLEVDAEIRVSAKEALKHKWFEDCGKKYDN